MNTQAFLRTNSRTLISLLMTAIVITFLVVAGRSAGGPSVSYAQQYATDISDIVLESPDDGLTPEDFEAIIDIITDVSVSGDSGEQEVVLDIIADLATSEDTSRRAVAADLVTALTLSGDSGQQNAAADLIANLVLSTDTDKNDAAADLIKDLAVSDDQNQQQAVVNLGEKAAQDPGNAVKITELFSKLADNADALKNLSNNLPVEVFVPEVLPVAGTGGWQSTSPADGVTTEIGILSRFPVDSPRCYSRGPGAHGHTGRCASPF